MEAYEKPCTAIRASRTVFTIWGCCAGAGKPRQAYGTCRSIESWSDREDERESGELRPVISIPLIKASQRESLL